MNNLIVAPDYNALSIMAAEIVAQAMRRKPSAAVVWPTGATPEGAACELAERKKRGQFDPSQMRLIQLDEYLGLTLDDPRTLYKWMERSFIETVGVPPANIMRFDTGAGDQAIACREYDRQISETGGIDLCVLGLGLNGHVGFNEPPVDAGVPTRVVALSPGTIAAHAEYFGGYDTVPRQAVTLGMAQILGAKEILLLVSGAHKKNIFKRAFSDVVSAAVPASWLTGRGNVTIIVDRKVVA